MPLLRLAAIRPNPDQPRKRFSDASLEELAASIRCNGLLQPILVRREADDQWLVIAGERRWRACKLAGLELVPCIESDVDDDGLAIAALCENLQREDISPIEEAAGMQAMLDRGMSIAELARRLGIGETMRLAQSLELLKLQPKPREALARRWLNRAQALEFAKLPPADQDRLFLLFLGGKLKGADGIKTAAAAILARDAQGELLRRPKGNATIEQQRVIGRFERRLETVARICAAGFDREGAINVLTQVRPEHAAHLAARANLVVKHLQMLARELRRAAVEHEVSAAHSNGDLLDA